MQGYFLIEFQYTVLMWLAKLEENQKNISETLGLLPDNDMAVNNDSGSLEVLQSIAEFEAEESKLKDNAYFQKKVVFNSYQQLQLF